MADLVEQKAPGLGNPLQKAQGAEKKRILRHFQAEKNSYSSANDNEIIIDISTPKELLDFSNGYLLFDMVATGGGFTGDGTQLEFNDWAASSWIREIRIEDRSGTSIGKAVNHYNSLVRMEYELKSNNEANQSYLNVLEGAIAKTSNGDAGVARQYAHRFISHIFTSPDYFPNAFLSGLRIILSMEQSANVVRSDGTTGNVTDPVYTISNLNYACDVIELMPSMMSALKSGLQQGGLDIHYLRSHGRKTTAITGAQQFKVGVIDGSIKNMQYYSIADTARATSTQDYWSAYTQNNLSSYRVFLNNKPLTDKRIQLSATRQAEYVLEYVKSQRLNQEQIIFGSEGLDLNGTRPVIGSRFDRSNSDEVISSLRDTDNNEVEVELEYSSSPAASTYYFHLLTDMQLKILPDRTFVDVAVKPTAGSLTTSST
jgi:hypothetical protein